jgi:hypothetical protein
MSTPVSFGTIDCLSNMVGAGILPLLVTPAISNFKMCHMLINGVSSLTVMSLHAFGVLWIPMSKITLSRPFDGIGSDFIMHYDSISFLITFGMVENHHM